MGLLKHLLFWPVTGPRFLFDFSLGKVEEVVRQELTDDTPVKSSLLELQLQLELGDIEEDEFVSREAELMRQLREIREWREQFGMGVSGGPVRVQSADAEEGARVSESALPAGTAAEAGPADDGGPRVVRPEDIRIELNLDQDG